MYDASKLFVLLTLLYFAVAEGYNGKSIKDDYFTFYRLLQQIQDFNGLVVKAFNSSIQVSNSVLLIQRHGHGFSVTKRMEEERPDGPVHEISREDFKKLYMILENALKTLNEKDNDGGIEDSLETDSDNVNDNNNLKSSRKYAKKHKDKENHKVKMQEDQSGDSPENDGSICFMPCGGGGACFNPSACSCPCSDCLPCQPQSCMMQPCCALC